MPIGSDCECKSEAVAWSKGRFLETLLPISASTIEGQVVRIWEDKVAFDAPQSENMVGRLAISYHAAAWPLDDCT